MPTGALAATELGSDALAFTGTVTQPPLYGNLQYIEQGSDTFIGIEGISARTMIAAIFSRLPPTAEAIAAAVLAAAATTPIASNVKKVNDVNVVGTGENGDPWGPQ